MNNTEPKGRDEVLRELDELEEAARLLGGTQAKRLFGCYTDEDRRFEFAMRRSVAKHRAALIRMGWTPPDQTRPGLRIIEPIQNRATPGTREAEMVVLETDENGVPTIWCDPEIADLVRALNVGGVRTVASCSGHGEQPGNIMLADGRELIVARDRDEARAMLAAALAMKAETSHD